MKRVTDDIRKVQILAAMRKGSEIVLPEVSEVEGCITIVPDDMGYPTTPINMTLPLLESTWPRMAAIHAPGSTELKDATMALPLYDLPNVKKLATGTFDGCNWGSLAQNLQTALPTWWGSLKEVETGAFAGMTLGDFWEPVYTFSKLREGGYTYVDKTGMILPLADGSIGSQFFISRPSRFGKSLLVSTLHALFEGRRELFKGLAIEPKWDWSKTWTVLHLDMGDCQADTVERLRGKVRTMLLSEADRLGVALRDSDPAMAFRLMIDDLAAKSAAGRIVLLVDEYDKPLLGHLSKPDVVQFRDALKEFYSVIKTKEAKLRFTFLTGVSKFSKVSIFSDLNNLKDRTMTPGEATLLGYTHEELKRYFPETLEKIGRANGLDAEGAFNKVLQWYDGYKFDPDGEKVVNPVSFGECAEVGRFDNYWSKTALTTFLTDALKQHPLDFSTLNVDQRDLEAYEPSNPRLVTLLYQTGYLTIKGFRQTGTFRKYDLCFPNLEVESSFLSELVPIYAGLDPMRSSNFQFAAAEALVAGDADGFVKALRSFFANIPYDLTDRQNEQMWQTIVYVVLKSIGVAVFAEVKTNEGRIDMTCETTGGIWLIEFKLDKSADEALAQIERNNYAEKFGLAGKKVFKLGISFSSEKRTIVDVKIAPISR